MLEILIPVISLTVLGLIFGMGLVFASRKFHVEVDPRTEKIYLLLPGANCGVCGSAGCFGFAECLVVSRGDIEKCRACDQETKEKIGQILGRSVEKKAKVIACLHCGGGKKVKDRFFYNQIKDCVAANILLKGQKECVYGCLGFGTCSRACPFSAITMTEENLPKVDEDKCRSCNKCVLVCPKKLYTLVPAESSVRVACSSHDIAKDVRAVCPVGCIGCRLCEKACEFDAIHVIDNLASIDYKKCTSCGKCVQVCPTKAIVEK